MDDVHCDACDAGYRLADTGIHYDDERGGDAWGVCRIVAALCEGDADIEGTTVFHDIARRTREEYRRVMDLAAVARDVALEDDDRTK